jgi:hypothetical protein
LRAEEWALLDSDASPWETTSRSGFDEHTSSLDTANAYTAWWQATPAGQRPEVLGVEVGFEVPLEGFELVGFIDRLDLDRNPDTLVVSDYKSGRGFDWQARWVQAAFYAIGTQHLTGVRPAAVRFINLDLGPSTQTFPVGPGWDAQLLRLCEHTRGVLEGDTPIPSFHGCGFCSFAPLCFDPERGVTPFTPLEALQEVPA